MSFLVCPAAQPLLQGLQVCCLPPGDLRLEPGLGATVGDREPGDREPGAFWLLNTQRGRLPGTRWTPICLRTHSRIWTKGDKGL